MSPKNPLIEKAIAAVGGSQKELARRIGGRVKQQHVHKWLYAQQVPAERAIQIEEATNGVVTRHELRPDLWPPPQSQSQCSEDRRLNPQIAVSQNTGEADGVMTARKPLTAGSNSQTKAAA